MSKCGRVKSLIKETIFRIGGVKLQFGKNYLSGLIVRKQSDCALSLGRGFSCRSHVIINLSAGGSCQIGKNVFINDDTKINARESITIGDGCVIGQGVMMYDHDHDFRSGDMQHNFVTKPIVIGNNVWIGSGVIILKGVTVGDNAVVAAGTIVRKDIPARVVSYDKRENVNRIYE